MKKRFTTPILFIVFNRLETTKVVFEVIKNQKPASLFIAADGARADSSGEIERCNEVREYVLNHIDWDCDVKTLFSEINLGCGLGPASAINWFFEHVEEGIILEDDCIAHPDFFMYCTELLEKYRENNRVAVIGGNNFQNNITSNNYSYYFSKYSYTWGWATWRRVWLNYQYDLNKIDKKKMWCQIDKRFKTNHEKNYWKSIFENVAKSNKSAWDYQLWFHVWLNNMCSIVPKANLVSNIGFGEGATHTTDINSNQAFLDTKPILPLSHPKNIRINENADYQYFVNYWSSKPKRSLLSKIYSILPLFLINLYKRLKIKRINNVEINH